MFRPSGEEPRRRPFLVAENVRSVAADVTLTSCAFCRGRGGCRHLLTPHLSLAATTVMPLVCRCLESRPPVRCHVLPSVACAQRLASADNTQAKWVVMGERGAFPFDVFVVLASRGVSCR